MKSSKHKTAMGDVLKFLSANGPTLAEDVGAHFWPDKVGMGPSRGGPSSVAVAATFLLARMRMRSWVEQGDNRKWHVTDNGAAQL